MAVRVLFVDDDRGVCEWATTGLGRRGFSVTARTSPSEALELLGAEDFDVVVADLIMPGLNGLELCERIVANRAGRAGDRHHRFRQPGDRDRRDPRRSLRLHREAVRARGVDHRDRARRPDTAACARR